MRAEGERTFPEFVYVAFRWEEATALAGGIDSSPKYADWEAISTTAKHVHEALMEQAAGDLPAWLDEDKVLIPAAPQPPLARDPEWPDLPKEC